MPTALLLRQLDQLHNPEARVVLQQRHTGALLNTLADSWQGICSGDYPRFGRCFWELSELREGWVLQLSTVGTRLLFGGREHILKWDNGGGPFRAYLVERLGQNGIAAWVRGLEAWGRTGVAVSQMRDLLPTIYVGDAYDNNVVAIVPRDPAHLPAIWCFCSSPEFNEAVRAIDQSLKVTNATLVQVPFDLERWQKVAEERYPNGLPEPFSDDPTQWIFHGHPTGSVIWDEQRKCTAHGPLRRDGTVLHVAVARLLGYRWPAELDPNMRLAIEQRAWAEDCAALVPYADSDGIVCLPAVPPELPAAERLRRLLTVCYRQQWSLSLEEELIAATGSRHRTLHDWLQNDFFKQHCDLFHDRPFIWHVWDGLPDGFSALVHYHRLDRRLLEKLIYAYIGDWLRGLETRREEPGAEKRIAAARDLQRRLQLILDGEPPYDIYVRWKTLAEQPMGWEPDLNDGVRMNIRPFVTAGVLRVNPIINWKKDRGTDPSPNCSGTTERLNDLHFTLEEKKKARSDARHRP